MFSSGANLNPAKPVEKDPNDIWDETEVDEKPVVDLDDPRAQPEYDLNYSQNVSSEDMFLQMGLERRLELNIMVFSVIWTKNIDLFASLKV